MAEATKHIDSASAINYRRSTNVRRIRNVINALGLFNVVAIFAWAYVRSFFCWDSSYCDPVEGLASSLGCIACQADVLVIILLAFSSIILIAMLVILFRHVTDPSVDLATDISSDSKSLVRRTASSMTRTAKSIHMSAVAMDKDGPGWWTLTFAVFAILIAVFYIFTENQSLTVLWW